MSKLISVIIPVYNAESYLSVCLTSIINQTYHNWELICIDDGSTDQSLNKLHEFAAEDKRIIVCSQKNSGPGIARNVGIDKAHGDYIVFVDSDDYLFPTYLQLLAEKNSDVVFIDVASVDLKGKYLHCEKMSSLRKESQDSIIRQQLTGKIPWGGVRKAVKTKLLNQNHIRYSSHKIGEEALYSFRVLESANSIDYIEDPMYFYVQHDDSQSHLDMDDPWGGVVDQVKEFMLSTDIYPSYKDTVNSFYITATSVSLNRIAIKYGLSKYLDFAKQARQALYEKLDGSASIDYKSMMFSVKIVWLCIKLRILPIIWFLGRLYNMKK